MIKNIDKILVYSGGETVGDGLYKINFIQNLRNKFPKSHITWMAGKGPTEYSRSLKPLISSLLDLIREDVRIGKSPLKELVLFNPLKDESFDLIIDTQNVVIPTIIIKKIRHRIFLSSTANWFFSDLKPKKDHQVTRSLNEKLNLFISLLIDEYPLKQINNNKIHNLYDLKYMNLAKKLLPSGQQYIGIAPGAGDKQKIWPIENFIEIATEQTKKNRKPVFFLGPSEKDLVPYIRKQVPEALLPEWDNLTLNSGLKGPILVIALASRLTLGVANDSGVGHMLAAGGSPLISLFSKHNPSKYAPVSNNIKIIDSKKWGGIEPKLIPIEEVVSSIENIINNIN